MTQEMDTAEDMLEKALHWTQEGRQVALATVVATRGSSPRPVGSQLVVDAQGAFEGSVSGGCIEAAVITEALEVIDDGKPRCLSFGVDDVQAWEVGLACGGEIDIYVEKVAPETNLLEQVMAIRHTQRPVCLVTDLTSGERTIVQIDDSESFAGLSVDLKEAIAQVHDRDQNMTLDLDGRTYFLHGFNPPLRLIIVGAVHVASFLAKMGQLTGYQVIILDPREAFANPSRFPDVTLKTEWPDEALEKMRLNSRTAIVTLTHEPKLDDPGLQVALRSEAFYIGALGSRKTHARRLERLTQAGFSEEELRRIHSPVGLDIGARSPAEIAISIMAQMIEKRRHGGGQTPY
jgi:xanthine dehydrogenase accessory factor